MSDERTFETPDGSETVTVPETFTRDDYASRWSEVPDEWDVEAVYSYDGCIRALAVVDSKVVEAMYETDLDRLNVAVTGSGWIVETWDVTGPNHDLSNNPGETLWTAENDDE